MLAFMRPETMRIVLLVLVGGGYLGYHLFHLWRKWAGRRRWAKAKEENPSVSTLPPAPNVGAGIGDGDVAETSSGRSDLQDKEGDRPCAPPPKAIVSPTPVPRASSFASPVRHRPQARTAALYEQARSLPHRRIPSFETDGLYLDLLGDAAAADYAPALIKLGEYAMRRNTWVEAYYWMVRAKRSGATDLDTVLREIRKSWTMAGRPDEIDNVYELFSLEAGSVGRALLDIGTGQEAYAAKEFLKSKHPDFLPPEENPKA